MDSSRSARSPLDPTALQAAAGPSWTVQLHAEAGSTNVLAATDPVPDLVVVADHQQAGRGRLDRDWVTPPGAALTFSAVVDPGMDLEWWPLVPLVTGYAVSRALGGYAAVKWPNDVLVDGLKVCGILVERVTGPSSGQPPVAVIGVGINVDQTAAELPVPTATSLTLAGHPVDRTALFGDVLASLRASLRHAAAHPDLFLNQYRDRSATLGQDVRVDLPDDRTVEGRVVDVDDHGRLLLRTAGETLTLSAGDVVHLRPAG
ncbi:biotin--[acetyl-CoA-carboxylase] ligase [Nocardioides cynanchi]|uniref:biotin--[acetyl-CoA-carboxylase] ligase n=1 Tax=Nocardioides cynanchi TaxID=2558918 RepID=UPI0012457059|nr:biotin--[acetyl-CoA-carboxylase] ligase [Nocardioides cynanchi]